MKKTSLVTIFACSMLFSMAARSAENHSCATLLSYLDTPTERIIFDIGDQSMGKDMGSFRELVINSHPEEFDTIFSSLTKKDILALGEKVKSGELEATPLQKTRLNALIEFVGADKMNTLFTKGGSPWSRLYTNYPQFRAPLHHDNVGGVIARTDTSTITELESELKKVAERASAMRISRGSYWQRFKMHPKKAFELIVSFNNQIRERLEHVEDVKSAIDREIVDERKKVGVILDEDEMRQVNELKVVLEEQLAKVRKDIQDVYEQDITTGGYQNRHIGENKGDLYRFVNNILGRTNLKKGQKAESELQSEVDGEYILTSEYVLNQFQMILQKARARLKKPERDENDMDKVELRVHNHQFRRLYRDEIEKWHSIMNQDTGETIRLQYSWTELESYPCTKTRTNAQGRTETYTGTCYRTVTKSDTATVELSFYDVIVDQLDRYSPGRSYDRGTIDWVRGKNDVLDSAKDLIKAEADLANARQLSKQIGDLMAANDQVIAQSKVSPDAYQKHLSDIEDRYNQLMDYIKRIDKDFLEAGFINRWRSDNKDHYMARHEQFRKSLSMLKEVYEVYREQVENKEYELVITPDTMAHDMRKLNRMYIYSIIRKSTAAISTLAMGMCLFHDTVVAPTPECVDLVWSLMKDWLGTAEIFWR